MEYICCLFYLQDTQYQQHSLYFAFCTCNEYIHNTNSAVYILPFTGCSHEGDGGPWQRWFIATLLTTITIWGCSWRKLPLGCFHCYWKPIQDWIRLPNKNPIFNTHSGEWMLNIRNVKHSDAGNYECQVTWISWLLIKSVVSKGNCVRVHFNQLFW